LNIVAIENNLWIEKLVLSESQKPLFLIIEDKRMSEYQGSCHCGAVRFSYEGEPIERGLRCNCSICARKGAMMTAEVIPPEKFRQKVLWVYTSLGIKQRNIIFANIVASIPFMKPQENRGIFVPT